MSSIMSAETPFLQPSGETRCLSGECSCRRYRYVIHVPENADETCRVIFDTNPTHQTSLATLLPGYLRVPLAWYQSSTHAAHDDETAAMIARVYEDSSAECTQRRFCGYCGTSLTYWCENPLSEAKFILITLGSLKAQHLNDLADMGFVSVGSDGPDVLSEAPEKMDTSPITTKEPLLTGVPWFDALIQDSPLRKMQHGVITKQTLERTIRVEWEISEWIDDASIADTCVDEGEGGMEWTASQAANKRKLQDLE